MAIAATRTVHHEIDEQLQKFIRGEIDYHALLIALVRIFDVHPSARAVALELIDRQQPTGVLQRGFFRVLRAQIEEELVARGSIHEPPTLPAGPAQTPRDEGFVARRPIERAAAVRPSAAAGNAEYAEPPHEVPATAPSVGRVEAAAARWHPSRIVPTRADDEGSARPAPDRQPRLPAERRGDERKRSYALFWIVGLVSIAFALKTPVQERLEQLADLGEKIPATFTPAGAPSAANTPSTQDREDDPSAATTAPAIEAQTPVTGTPEQYAVTEAQPEAVAAPAPEQAITMSAEQAGTSMQPKPATPAGASGPAADVPPATGPGRLGFASGAYRVRENDGMVALTLVRADGSDGPVSVTWWTHAGTALAAEDYADFGSRVESFADGETAHDIYVPIASDDVSESPEAFAVYVGDPTDGAALGAITQATVTIADDDD